jgi:hypothetical protein
VEKDIKKCRRKISKQTKNILDVCAVTHIIDNQNKNRGSAQKFIASNGISVDISQQK